MRKSLIITAALMVSSLFAGTALADESRGGGEKPALRADRSDGMKAYAEKVRERNEINTRAVSTKNAESNRRLEKHRAKGDMVDGSSSRSTAAQKARVSQGNQGRSLIQRTVSEKRADISDRSKKNNAQSNSGNTRAFTVANDRHANRNGNGPRTIVDVMARRELLKFLGGVGVKINCSQTGTCTESPI